MVSSVNAAYSGNRARFSCVQINIRLPWELALWHPSSCRPADRWAQRWYFHNLRLICVARNICLSPILVVYCYQFHQIEWLPVFNVKILQNDSLPCNSLEPPRFSVWRTCWFIFNSVSVYLTYTVWTMHNIQDMDWPYRVMRRLRTWNYQRSSYRSGSMISNIHIYLLYRTMSGVHRCVAGSLMCVTPPKSPGSHRNTWSCQT